MSTFLKLSYLHNIGKDPLRALTLGNLLEISAEKFADREAIVSLQQNQRLTYRNLLQKADEFAAGLYVLGLRKGDRLGLWAPNLAEWCVVNMACVRAGIIVVALNPGSQSTEMEYYINKVKIKTIVCPHLGKYQNYYQILNKIVPALEAADTRKLSSPKVPSLESIILISDDDLRGTYNYKEIMDLANETTISKIKNSQHLIQPDSACYIQFSSGTTGQPKAAVASHFQVVNNSFEIGKRNELDRKHHKICVQVPFFHAFGTTVTLGAAINFGATVVVGSATYSPMENLKALKQENCTTVYGTPTMFVDLIVWQKRLKMDIKIDIAVTGGAPCSPQLFKQIQEILKVEVIKSIYGLTEATAVAFQSLPVHEEEFKICSTVGHIGAHLEAKIIDSNDNIVPMGIPGELCLRGYSTMLGYWDDADNFKKTIGPDKWLRTGDQFILREDGYGIILGRLKDTIIRGGENIFPKEIEDFLNTHGDIIESQVIGLPHERLGEEVCACVKLKENSTLTQQSLVEYCKGKIAFSKIPSQLRIVQEFPKTTSGKIQKNRLRKQIQDN